MCRSTWLPRCVERTRNVPQLAHLKIADAESSRCEGSSDSRSTGSAVPPGPPDLLSSRSGRHHVYRGTTPKHSRAFHRAPNKFARYVLRHACPLQTHCTVGPTLRSKRLVSVLRNCNERFGSLLATYSGRTIEIAVLPRLRSPSPHSKTTVTRSPRSAFGTSMSSGIETLNLTLSAVTSNA